MGCINPSDKNRRIPVSSQIQSDKSRKVPVSSQIQSHCLEELQDITNLAKKTLKKDWHQLEIEDLAGRIIDLEDRISLLPKNLKGVEKVEKFVQHLRFLFICPGALELETRTDPFMPPSYIQNIKEVAGRILKEGSLTAFYTLTEQEQEEVRHGLGSIGSPEGLAHAIGKHAKGLKRQASAAESFLFGRVQEGAEGLSKLPERVQARIGEILWDTSGGDAIDLSEKESQARVATAIMLSLDERMGSYD